MSNASLGTKVKNSFLVLNRPPFIKEERTIVVLGVERGGTSMVAGVLRGLGVSMGEKAGLNHEDPAFLSSDQTVLTKNIVHRNKERALWGFKVPKATLAMDFYEAKLRNPYYVIIYRNPVSIVDSWMQRGAGSEADVLQRTVEYHAALSNLCSKSSNPILICGYERIVSNSEASKSFIHGLMEFLGLPDDTSKVDRALAMISGDGSGYLDLPEYHFTMQPIEVDQIVRKKLAIVKEHSVEETEWVEYDRMAPTMIYKMENGENLPKRFLLELDLDLPEKVDLRTLPLRVYFNFTGKYFPGHCTRPPVKRGLMRYEVETSGEARDFALGPLSLPMKIKAKVGLYPLTASDGFEKVSLRQKDVMPSLSRRAAGRAKNEMRKVKRFLETRFGLLG